MKINGVVFNEIPRTCGECKFSVFGGSEMDNRGWCALFAKSKNRYNSPPKRCQKLFDKAATYGDDVDLVIVISDKVKP